jgi:hypothetical protein
VPPTFPFSGKRIRDLTDVERRQWCEWQACDYSHFASTEPLPEGTVAHFNGCAYSGDPAVNAFVGTQLSLPICEANLAVSQCEALVSELTDCKLTLRTNVPAPRGCGPYLAKPGCSGTIITRLSEYSGSQGGAGPGGSIQPSDCTLRIR